MICIFNKTSNQFVKIAENWFSGILLQKIYFREKSNDEYSKFTITMLFMNNNVFQFTLRLNKTDNFSKKISNNRLS